MMKKLYVIIGLIVFVSSGAFASNDFRGVGNWSDPNIWTEGRPPSGEEEVKVRGEETICTLNTSSDDWGVGQRMRVYEGATLIVEEGGELLGAGWLRVGASNPGYVSQTGGLVQIQNGNDDARLGIGDQGDSDGYYTISGGTLTYAEGSAGDLIVGARGGKGTLTIVGSKPAIQMGLMTVGDRAGAIATVEFIIDANGVSPIVLDVGAAIDELGDETSTTLLVSAIDAPPAADIVLVDIPDGVDAANAFDSVNGVPAVEGASVVISAGGVSSTYNLTYAGGTGNDIALVFDHSVNLAPISLGAFGDIELGNDAQVGPDSSSNGSGLGARNISARRRVILISYDISELAGPISNVSLNNFSHDLHDEVVVYGVIEDMDLLDVESLTWNTAPGVMNDPTPELEAPIALDMADLTEALLTFEGPGETGVRFSTDASEALADFINSDTDGILTLLIAASAEENQLIIRSREHSAGGTLLEGEVPAPAPVAIPIENASFELPGTEKIKGWNGEGVGGTPAEDIPGWSSDSEVADSGVETGWGATDGEWTAFLMGGDPSVWQLTSYVIGADDVIEMKVDSKNNWQATTVQLVLYYDDNGVRIPAAIADGELTDEMQEFSVVLNAADAPDAVGALLGIEINNVTEASDSWLAIDNVRLTLQ